MKNWNKNLQTKYSMFTFYFDEAFDETFFDKKRN